MNSHLSLSFVTNAELQIGIPDFRSKDGLYALLTRGPTPSSSKTRIEDTLPSNDVLEIEDDSSDEEDLLRPAKRVKLAKAVKGQVRLIQMNISSLLNLAHINPMQDLFSANLFRQKETAQLFYIFMSSLYTKCQAANPTETHRFLKKLHDKNKLLRCYTQNIDGLEGRAGLPYAFDYTKPRNTGPAKGKKSTTASAKVVQLHGSLNAVRCGCSWAGSWTDDMVQSMQAGTPPPCPDCQSLGALLYFKSEHFIQGMLSWSSS